MSEAAASAVAVLVVAGVHVIAGKLRFLDGVPRSRWLSMAGGVSVAYVFVHLLPELARHNRDFMRGSDGDTRLMWVLALGGLVVYYGLERIVRRRRSEQDGKSGADAVFWLHIAAFALYNAVIGAILGRGTESPVWLFTVAISVHFLVTDYSLRNHHQRTYDELGRWVVTAAIIVGWLVGATAQLPGSVIGASTAVLAGAIVLNAMKEELPDDRDGRVLPFTFGAAAYATLVVFI